jgi:hypothetical protein
MTLANNAQLLKHIVRLAQKSASGTKGAQSVRARRVETKIRAKGSTTDRLARRPATLDWQLQQIGGCVAS